jgi:hypothetical protein
MAYYRIPLKAGVAHVQDVSGALILVDGIDGAAGVDVTPIVNGSRQVAMPARKAGFKYRTQYDAVELVAASDCEVRIFLTNSDVSLGFADGAQVNVLGSVQVTNSADQRLPVDLAGGTITVTAENVGITNDDTMAVPVRSAVLQTIEHTPGSVLNTGVAVLLDNDPLWRKLFIRNASATAIVALGGADVDLTNAAIILLPGETWVEDSAAGAAWYAATDTNATPVTVMGMK